MGATRKNLNDIQLHFLQYFSEFDITKQESDDIKNLVSNYYFEKAERALDNLKNVDAEFISKLESENLHYRISK